MRVCCVAFFWGYDCRREQLLIGLKLWHVYLEAFIKSSWKNMKKIITIALLMISPALIAHAGISACPHIEYGKPKVSDFQKCRLGYAIGYSYALKSAEWVTYRLEKEDGEVVGRQDDFRPDSDMPQAYQTTPGDYDEPVYDMGHLANSESIDGSVLENSETFLMSNMTPQLPGFNRAIWKGLENRERKWADEFGVVFVFMGPLYGLNPDVIGNGVLIPSSFWKIIYSPMKKEAIAFLIPHKELKTSELDSYLISIDEIETASGLDFFQALSDAQQVELEGKALARQW